MDSYLARHNCLKMDALIMDLHKGFIDESMLISFLSHFALAFNVISKFSNNISNT